MTIDLDRFHRQLEDELAQLQDALMQASAPVAAVAIDPLSGTELAQMDALKQQAIAKAIRERLPTRKRALQAAFARIGAGTFGRCCQCDSALELERLEGDVAAVFCLDCVIERDAQK
jgi:DnaK suppressor protein